MLHIKPLSIFSFFRHRKYENMSRKHDAENKDQIYSVHHINNCFILNNTFSVENSRSLRLDLTCLRNGLLVIDANNESKSEFKVMTFSVKGKPKHAISVDQWANKIAEVDINTVALSLRSHFLHVAIVDIQQSYVRYIRNENIPNNSNSIFMFKHNRLYFANELGITVCDMSGFFKRRIELGFTVFSMCNDFESQRIYCINSDKSKLICLNENGTIMFTFADQNWTNLNSLTTDNDGNVLVLCVNRGDNLGCVIKVDSSGNLSGVVISNILLPRTCSSSCICFHRLRNSVVIGVDETVYIYKKKENV